MSEIAEQLANLSPEEQRALLSQLLRKKIQEPKLAPLSLAQERVWFFDQLVSGSTGDLMSSVHFTNQLDVAALEQSLDEIVRRHETLRTTFTVVDGQPMQVIAPPQSFSLSVIDLCHLPPATREVEVQRLTEAEAQYRSDLTQGPLFRANLLWLSEKEYILLLNTHHIVSDGWSIGILVREVLALYQAFSTGNASPLSDLPIQYADFARWQRERLQGEGLEAQLAYWKQQLRDAPTVLGLPTDRPRLSVQDFRSARQPLELPKFLTEALKALGQREESTLFMVVLAAFQVLLGHYTGQEDISVGTFIANRSLSELEGLIGLLIDPLVLRTDLSGNPTFRELLRRAREVTLGAYTHRDFPFEELLQELRPARDQSFTPLFQVMLVFRDMSESTTELELPGPVVQQVEGDRYANSDLALFLWEASEGLVGFIEYNADLFDATTIVRVLGHFQTLLEDIVANPEQRLSELSLLTEAEREQLLKQWSHTGRDYTQNLCVHDLFEQEVNRTPTRVSVVGNQGELALQQLKEQADQLAHFLGGLNQ